MLTENKHISSILRSFEKYFEGTIDLEGLEKNVNVTLPAIEGDVPKESRAFLENLSAEIELVRFTVEDGEQNQAIHELYSDLTDHIMRAS